MVSQSTFPRQIKLGGRAVAWVRVEVIEWCDLNRPGFRRHLHALN
ncbi:AlpA family phage regulatory protein [Pseudomonas extremaustralis]|nr:AlpA family phage regulatory protein [Pseudomonas extremaustralis]